MTTKTHSEQLNEIAQALAKMQMEIGSIAKNKTAKIPTKSGTFSFSYADLSAILEAIRKPLSNNGLCISQTFEDMNGSYCLISMLLHCSGQFIKSFLPINVNALDIKQIGAQITYSRRYALTSLLGICGDDDNEEGVEGNVLASPPKKEDKKATSSSRLINQKEEEELESLLQKCEDHTYVENIRKYYADQKNIHSWKSLPQEMYLALRQNILNKLSKKNPEIA